MVGLPGRQDVEDGTGQRHLRLLVSREGGLEAEGLEGRCRIKYGVLEGLVSVARVKLTTSRHPSLLLVLEVS